MIKNYIKIAYRSLMRNKLFSIINISGLTIGMVSFVLIMLYVNYEKSYDKSFPNSNRICRVYMDYLEGDVYQAGDAQTYNLSGPTLKENFPEIEEFVRTYQLGKSSIVYNNNAYQIKYGHLADASYFKVFGNPIYKGVANEALEKPNTIVLSKSLSSKIFKDENPIGKNVILYNSGDKVIVTVSGIMNDVPENTHMKTDFLVSFVTGKTWDVGQWDLNWDNNNFYTFILLKNKINVHQFKNKVMAFDDKVEDERHNIEPLTDIHLHSNKPWEAEANGSSARVLFLLAIALVIMVLSWLNYVNLSISKAMERALETGVRKASGASKAQLITQFLVESILINSLSVFLAIGLAIVLLPIFNEFTGKDLVLGVLGNGFYIVLVAFIFFGSMLSGLIPALILSNANPAMVLKGKSRKKTSNSYAQKILVTTQIAATIILIVSTIAINKQIRFLQNQPMGFNSQQVIALTGDVFSESSHMETQLGVLKTELDKLNVVSATAFSQSYPGDGFTSMSMSIGLTLPDGTEDNRSSFYYYSINKDFIPLMDFELLAGRNYAPQDNMNSEVIINEEMSKMLGFSNPNDIIGQTFGTWGTTLEIIGVLKNHHHFGIKTAEKSMLYRYQPKPFDLPIIKLSSSSTQSMQKALAEIEQVWNTVFKQSLFEYTFIDEKVNQQFIEDRKFNNAFSFFTLLAIIIASLGLFGLGTQICTQRTKEIGIRKVNGAKIFEVIAMLNKEFVQWVTIAFVIAAPISYFAMNKWLQTFAYKTTLSWWVFALAGIATLTIAILTVSWHTFRAARRNPVEALRYE